jgi:formylglycine-generating enzyme required for sulfatase activity
MSEGTTTVPVTGVTLDKTSASLSVGGTETLIVTITPTNATNKAVTWSSSNTAVATVDASGVVTAVAAGSTTITVTTADGNKTAMCTVTVNKKTGSAVSAPTVNGSPTNNSITVNTVSPPSNGQSVEYAISMASNGTGLSAWQSSTTFTGLSSGTTYYVYARSASDTYYYDAGLPSVSAGITTAGSSISPTGIVMVPVLGGSFQMGKELGTTGSGDVTPVHTVTLTGFSMSKYPVTQAQYQAVMGSNPSNFSSNPESGETQGNRPVEKVSWYDAIVFCNKLSIAEDLSPAYSINNSTDPAVWGNVPTSDNSTWNSAVIVSGSTGYRLPTEAQWEYAVKGGITQENLTYAGSNTTGDVAWYSGNSGSKTHEVGKKAPNALGLYDMSGNVCDWCWDWYGNYSNGAQTDPGGASSGANRIVRGGGWNSSAANVRSVYRNYGPPSYRSESIGFRLVRP